MKIPAPHGYVLGAACATEDDVDRAVGAALWLTYRCGFPEMTPYAYTDDAGWGCMLRSAQMLMANALLRHGAPRGDVPSCGEITEMGAPEVFSSGYTSAVTDSAPAWTRRTLSASRNGARRGSVVETASIRPETGAASKL